MNRIRRLIICAMIATIALAAVAAFVTPLSAGAGNASKAAAAPHTARVGNGSAAAVKTPPTVGAATWHTETVDSVGYGTYTSLKLTPSGWPAISYCDYANGDLKYTYKSDVSWHNQQVDTGGAVGAYNSLQLTPTGWPAISYYDYTNYNLKYAYKSAS